jgi:hypothetical protein
LHPKIKVTTSRAERGSSKWIKRMEVDVWVLNRKRSFYGQPGIPVSVAIPNLMERASPAFDADRDSAREYICRAETAQCQGRILQVWAL